MRIKACRGSLALVAAIGVTGTLGSSGYASAAPAPAVIGLVGMTAPSHRAAIAAEQSGTIVEMKVGYGDRIETGDVLFRLSSRLEQLEVDRLQALVESDLERARAQANLEHAKKRVGRMSELLEKQISAESDVLDVELQSELARLSLNKVEFDRMQLVNELQQSRERLEQRTLRSPLTGVVTKLLKQLGETADELEPVVEVISLDPLWVQFECPVAYEKRFQVGGFVRVQPVVGDEEPRTARIFHTSMEAAVAGHTFTVRAAVDNKDYSWRSGLKMRVESMPDPQAKPPGGK